MGNLGLVDADYEWVTQRLFDLAQKYAKGRIVSCLEGGYVMSPLARSAAAHVKVLIGAAVFVGLVQAVLPWATHHPDYIAKELSARLHRPVKFAAITSEWQPSGPLLTVSDLTLGPGASGGQSVVHRVYAGLAQL